jgi:hypothetical protein
MSIIVQTLSDWQRRRTKAEKEAIRVKRRRISINEYVSGEIRATGRSSMSNRFSPEPEQTAAKAKATLRQIAKRSPQVMVKITGGGRSQATIAAHLKYIGKHDTAIVFDQDGEILEKDAIKEAVDGWEKTTGYIPKTQKTKEEIEALGERVPVRQAYNIILSMPEGTDPEKVLQAAKETAQDRFGDYQYFYAMHVDRGHPHVHFCVRNKSHRAGTKKLFFGKNDIQGMRKLFAERLQEAGIDCQATSRATRNEKNYTQIHHEVGVINRVRKERRATLRMVQIAAKEQNY